MKALMNSVLALILAVCADRNFAQQCIEVPVHCQVTSAFGTRYNPVTKSYASEFHHGVDFGCPIGTPVNAVVGGVVSWAGDSKTAGNWVRERDASGPTLYEYMHHERNLTSMGSALSAGQQIALTGSTGRSTGPHLHFQIKVNDVAVDPMSKFCTKPGLRPGVLDGAPPQGDILAEADQATPPGDSGGTPLAMGMDGSLFDILGDAIAARALNPDYMRQLSTLTEPRLYAELAYMKALRLRVQLERSQHRERLEATQAMLTILMTESSLRLQLEAQRAAASKLPQ